MVAQPALVGALADDLVAAVVAEDEHQRVVEQPVTQQTREPALELAVEVAQRRRVTVRVPRQGRDVRMDQWHHEGVMRAQGEGGEEERLPGPPQRLDAAPHLIEERAVGDAQAHALGVGGEVALVEELADAVARQEERSVVLVVIAVVADHHLGPVARALQQRRQAEVVVRVAHLDRRLPIPRQLRAQRREQAVMGQLAVGEEVVEHDRVAAPAVQVRREARAHVAAIERLDEDEQDVEPPRLAPRRGMLRAPHERVVVGGKDPVRRHGLARDANGLVERHEHLGARPGTLLVGAEGQQRCVHGLPDGILSEHVVRGARDSHPRDRQRPLPIEAGGAGHETDAERDEARPRPPRRPSGQGRLHPASERPAPGEDHHRLHQGEGREPSPPLAGLADLGARLLERLPRGPRCLGGARTRRPAPEHLVHVLEEDGVEVLAVVAVVRHVDRHHERAQHGQCPAPDAERRAEDLHRATPALPRRHERPRRRHHAGDQQRDEDAQARHDEVGPGPGQQGERQDGDRRRFEPRGVAQEERAVGALREEEHDPPEDDHAQDRRPRPTRHCAEYGTAAP